MFIRYRPHNASYGQAVEIIINKDQHAKNDGCHLRSYPALDMRAGPASKCRRSASLIHHADHDSKNYQEHQDSHIVTVRQHAYDSVLEYMRNRLLKRKS